MRDKRPYNNRDRRPSYNKDGKPGWGGGRRHERERGGERSYAPAGSARPKGHASLWGVHAVTEAWLNPERKIKEFYVTETALAEFKEVLERGKTAGLKRPEPTLSERRDMDRMLPEGAVHQGLAIDAAPLEEIFIADLAIRAGGRPKSIIVMLDQVTDPHNVGAILRSASAFGALGVVMQSRHAPEITGVLAKAACGAVEHIAIAYETNLNRALEYLQEQGFTAIGLDERGEKTMAQIPVPDKAVLVLGAEGKGMRQNLREHCNLLARLPTQGAILSLNVSNAAAVALYALVGG